MYRPRRFSVDRVCGVCLGCVSLTLSPTRRFSPPEVPSLICRDKDKGREKQEGRSPQSARLFLATYLTTQTKRISTESAQPRAQRVLPHLQAHALYFHSTILSLDSTSRSGPPHQGSAAKHRQCRGATAQRFSGEQSPHVSGFDASPSNPG